MGCDLVVALGQATVSGPTIMALNLHGDLPQGQALVRLPGREHAPDEIIRTQFLEIPQVRQTYTVLGQQPAGSWGFAHGINEHRLIVGHSQWWSQLPGTDPGLLGSDLVRLLLQRAKSARNARDLLGELLTRHGQSRRPENGGDNVLVLADAKEAFVVETAGSYWAWIEIQQVRAVSDLGLIRQDWQGLAPGLGEYAIQERLWPDDGSKLDFARTLGNPLTQQSSPLKRWGRASLLLEQQNGHLDSLCFRNLLDEHFEATLRNTDTLYHGSFIAQVSQAAPPLTWISFGPDGEPLYFPVPLAADLPEAYTHPEMLWGKMQNLQVLLKNDPEGVQGLLSRLQSAFDHDTDHFLAQANGWSPADLHREASNLMQRHLDSFETEIHRLQTNRRRPQPTAASIGTDFFG